MARSKSLKQQEQPEQQIGGEGAADNGAAVFGAPGEQHANPVFGNAIATKVGGQSQLSKQQLQKSILKQLKLLKQSGGSLAFSDYSSSASVPSAEVAPSVAANTNVPLKIESGVAPSGPTVGGSESDMLSLGNLTAGFTKSGGKLSKQQLSLFSQELDKLQQKQQGGVGLNEIIVPLILLYATQRYSQGRTFKSKSKSMSRSMRRSRRFRR